jgi:hypothetical protein
MKPMAFYLQDFVKIQVFGVRTSLWGSQKDFQNEKLFFYSLEKKMVVTNYSKHLLNQNAIVK